MAPRDTWLSEGGEDDCCSCREILEDLGLVGELCEGMRWGGAAKGTPPHLSMDGLRR